ncbi:hypothetical protein ACQZV8_18290 [Magnetococcales bacterium HHB-1]
MSDLTQSQYKTVPQIEIDQDDAGPTFSMKAEPHQLRHILGTESAPFASDTLLSLIGLEVAKSPKKPDEQRINAMIAAVAGIKPRNEVEAMLAVQMVGIHQASMGSMLAANGESMPAQGRERYLNQVVKLSRTFMAQMEALNRYRGKGQQKVTVEHVHVNEGGQAIVGAVSQGGE